MNTSTRPAHPGPAQERTLPDATLKAAGAWIAQFARTLKTCRLYDAANPTVVRFRDELGQAARRLVSDCGALTFRFEAEDVTLDGQSLYPARSRDDNLAYAFHRDGVRSLTLNPGLEADEVQSLVDAVLEVTGQNLDEGDLVTTLWEAHLRHVDVDYVPAEGDVGVAAASPGEEGGEALLPWPAASTTSEPPPGEANATERAGPEAGQGRSEDWTLGDLTVEVEATYVELDALAPGEVERFRREFVEEHSIPPVAAALAISMACLRANANEHDRAEMGHFLPRVLRGSLGTGAWVEAREALRTLRQLPPGTWSEETFLQELMQPVSVTRTVERLDAQEDGVLVDFLALAQEIGDPSIDWVTIALSESQQRRTRMLLADSLAQRCRENPERLAPWLADSRWYVVRNIVYILSYIGGPAIAGLLAPVARHPDPRVREQVVSALSNLDLRQARPLLIKSLEGAPTKLFCQILSLLSGARDPATARFVFAYLQQEKFPERPPEERRAIYAAVASVGGNEIVPDLEAELLKANWFDRDQEIHRHNVARCLARVGTPRAREALERAANSKRPPVRQAAQAGLALLRVS